MSAPRRIGDDMGQTERDLQAAREAAANKDSEPAGEAEASAGPEANREAFHQALDVAVRERDRALDKATTRLASVTAGGYLEYDRSVSVALAAFESAWHNARTALAVAGDG